MLLSFEYKSIISKQEIKERQKKKINNNNNKKRNESKVLPVFSVINYADKLAVFLFFCLWWKPSMCVDTKTLVPDEGTVCKPPPPHPHTHTHTDDNA